MCLSYRVTADGIVIKMCTNMPLLLCLLQKSETKLEEILKEIKSLKDLVSSQEKRIINLEERMSKIAI